MVKILIVEDEIVVAKDIQKKLEKRGFRVVDIVSTGREALKTTKETHPDLVLMDIRLEGGMDGIDAADRIKKQFNIPVIYITAYADDETLKRAKITEPYGYILKPFEIRELYSNIEMALYKHRAESELVKYRLHLEKLVERRTGKLKRVNEQLKKEVNNRRRAENDANRIKERLQNIISSASEVIISFDRDYKVRTWNNSAEIVTGYTQREIVGRHVTKVSVFDNPEDLVANLESIVCGKKPFFKELVVKTKNNTRKILQVSFSLIRGVKDDRLGVLFIGKDITSFAERHGRLLQGRSYLIVEEENRTALNIFMDLSKIEHKGLLITRDTPDMIKELFPVNNISLVLLSQEKLRNYHNISNLEEICAYVKDFSKNNPNSIILLDGVHFLLSKFSFNEFVSMVFQIREVVSNHNSIFLLQLDPALLDNKQRAVLKHEMESLPSHRLDDVVIGEDLFEILKFVYDMNQKSTLVSMKDVSDQFSIVHRTTTKRLGVLEKKGLIVIKKLGRLKSLYVSVKGESLLIRRQVL